MGNIKLYLNTGKGLKAARPIMVSYCFNGQRLIYYTGLHISEYEFNPDSKEFPAKAKCIDRVFINTRLILIRNMIGEISNEVLASGETLTPDLLRERLNRKLKAKPVKVEKAEKKTTFLEYFDIYIKDLPNRINPITGAKLSKAMPVKYTNVKNLFMDFCKHEGRNYDFNDINENFNKRFIAYMLNEKKYAVNTYGRALKFLKTILKDATKQGFNTSTAYQSIITGISEPSESIYLNEAELNNIYNLDLSKTPGRERVRDLFLIGCYTGLRFSDYTTINPEDVKGGRLRIQAQKTKQNIVIPIHPNFEKILQKYNFQLPPAISNQKFNEALKEIAREAKITETVVTRITKGGEVQTTSQDKCELVTSHVARRSFATNSFKRGVEPLLIMAITGHKTEKEFQKYIKVSEEEKADLFAKSINWEEKPKVERKPKATAKSKK